MIFNFFNGICIIEAFAAALSIPVQLNDFLITFGSQSNARHNK